MELYELLCNLPYADAWRDCLTNHDVIFLSKFLDREEQQIRFFEMKIFFYYQSINK